MCVHIYNLYIWCFAFTRKGLKNILKWFNGFVDVFWKTSWQHFIFKKGCYNFYFRPTWDFSKTKIKTFLRRLFDHSVNPPPLLSAGRRGRMGWTPYQIFKEGGLNRTSGFGERLLGKRGATFFRGSCNFSTKIKLKLRIFDEKERF